MIKKDKEGLYVEVEGKKIYIDKIDEMIDDLVSLIKLLREVEKLANKYEDEYDELFEVIRKKIVYYATVLKEIYSD
jgi:phage-related minor tail protein